MDTTALAASLSLLPLAQVIGVEPKYLQSVKKLYTPPQSLDKDVTQISPTPACVTVSTESPSARHSELDTPSLMSDQPSQEHIHNNITCGNSIPQGNESNETKVPKSAVHSKKIVVDDDDGDDLDSLLGVKQKETVAAGKERIGRLKKSRQSSGDEDDLDALLDMSRVGGALKLVAHVFSR